MIGLDTGFYVELLRDKDLPIQVWKQLIKGQSEAVSSVLTLFELDMLGLRGQIEQKGVDLLLEAIPSVCKLVWIHDLGILRHGARLSHGLGIPAMDSLILASLIREGASLIYTTDGDFEKYDKGGVRVVNLMKLHEA